LGKQIERRKSIIIMSILHRNHSNANISEFTCYERRKGNVEKGHPKKWVTLQILAKKQNFL
jgi:hypothetical protein